MFLIIKQRIQIKFNIHAKATSEYEQIYVGLYPDFIL
jgi:hypothetical protein